MSVPAFSPVRKRSSPSFVTMGMPEKAAFPPCGIRPFVRLQQMTAGYSPSPFSGPPLSPHDVISTCGMLPSGKISMASAHAWRE